jgi:hypothetical protein
MTMWHKVQVWGWASVVREWCEETKCAWASQWDDLDVREIRAWHYQWQVITPRRSSRPQWAEAGAALRHHLSVRHQLQRMWPPRPPHQLTPAEVAVGAPPSQATLIMARAAHHASGRGDCRPAVWLDSPWVPLRCGINGLC